MKNVINNILKSFKLFGDIILSLILLLFYLVFFSPYKIFSKETNNKSGWKKLEKYNLENKNFPF